MFLKCNMALRHVRALRIFLKPKFSCVKISGRNPLAPPRFFPSKGSSCITPQGAGGVCTVLPRCVTSFETINLKPIALRSLLICSFDKEVPIVCCENSEQWDGSTNERKGDNVAPHTAKNSTSETNVLITMNGETSNRGSKNSKSAEEETAETGSGRFDNPYAVNLTLISTPSTSTPLSIPMTITESDEWIITALLNTPHLSPADVSSVKGLNEAHISNGTERNVTKTSDTRRPAEMACDQYTKKALKAIDFHIISGIPVKPGEFPHMAAIAFPTVGGPNFEFKCGASLISENYALTAAHCVNRPELHPLFLRLGKISLKSNVDDQLDATDVGVDEVILHPEYKGSSVYNDIALLKLNYSVEFNSFVRPVCLYTNRTPFPMGTILTVTGWGKTTFVGGSFNDVLLKANLTQVDQNECNQTYAQNGDLGRRMKLGVQPDGQLCAFGKENQDACQGDSGGPLQIVEEEGSSTQVGIVSIGIGCGLLPGVYTKVADYLDWIESIAWP